VARIIYTKAQSFSYMRALDRLKQAVSMKSGRRSVELPDGSEFEFWMTPLTLAERAKAQKQARSDDATDFALQLLVSKARDENNQPLFHQGDIAELRNALPAKIVESVMLELIGDEQEAEEESVDYKSSEESTGKGSSTPSRTRGSRKAE
jgi:hypothetical protein